MISVLYRCDKHLPVIPRWPALSYAPSLERFRTPEKYGITGNNMFLCQSWHIYPRNRSTGTDRNQCDMYSWSRTEYYYEDESHLRLKSWHSDIVLWNPDIIPAVLKTSDCNAMGR
ncbi:hypothetical protein ARMGADRAFT_816548 [Armillaria gallica]|uniref:Uncharacterized protein n=1 Tax=Armillaria gallica TaxID=47427 RepID=A0A2H3CY41_ARMGA|nr:hypothetical protein ARMGADRAFT_816548 [Armillaria gallica]